MDKITKTTVGFMSTSVALNISALIMTLRLLTLGFEEANPVTRYFIYNGGVIPFLIVMYVLYTLGMMYLNRVKVKKLGLALSVWVFLVLAFDFSINIYYTFF